MCEDLDLLGYDYLPFLEERSTCRPTDWTDDTAGELRQSLTVMCEVAS